MSDTGSISAASGIQNRPDQAQEQAQKEDFAKSQCKDCLKSSITKGSDGPKLNTADAIEKLDLVKQTLTDDTLKAKIDVLKDTLQAEKPKDLAKPDHLKAILDKAFQTQQASASAKLNQQQQQVQLNPFQAENPFAPKVYKKEHVAKATQSDLDNDDPSSDSDKKNKNDEESAKKAGPFKRFWDFLSK